MNPRLKAYADGAAMARSQAARLRAWAREYEQAAVRADERAAYYEECAERERSAPHPMTADEIIETIEGLTMKRECVA
jgi:hypothetical protein